MNIYNCLSKRSIIYFFDNQLIVFMTCYNSKAAKLTQSVRAGDCLARLAAKALWERLRLKCTNSVLNSTKFCSKS